MQIKERKFDTLLSVCLLKVMGSISRSSTVLGLSERLSRGISEG
jgi:hypothetical protein